ncbi:MAG TPA: methylmalonyl-CoA mutase family protein, partial [Thermoanaerobaculia bacterium]|nr:methylmalonyl-CoA mutase family protein [Thermoanaerobaculia bacterium]
SVRRAMAIQLIINREWGLAKNENPNQGSFIIEELTDLVEEAGLKEVERGWAPADVLTGRPLEARFHVKAGNGAAPPLVFVSLFIGQEMTLFVNPVDVAVLALSVLIAGQVSADGESNWLEGAQLLVVWAIVAMAFLWL